MNQKSVVILIAALMISPTVVFAEGKGKEFREHMKSQRQAHREEQHGENKAFRDTLKDKTAEEKKAAIKAHREEQHGENVAFHKEMKGERQAALKKFKEEREAKRAERKKMREEMHANQGSAEVTK